MSVIDPVPPVLRTIGPVMVLPLSVSVPTNDNPPKLKDKFMAVPEMVPVPVPPDAESTSCSEQSLLSRNWMPVALILDAANVVPLCCPKVMLIEPASTKLVQPFDPVPDQFQLPQVIAA